MAYSEPGYGGHGVPQAIPDAYSAAPGDAANRAARADGVAANRNEAQQDLQGGSNKKARIDDVTKLVAEENASRSKFPRYQGLERWELIEKMGDGAFSNVYRARDTEGKVGEVAIKVVRKFEMNSMQVSRAPSVTDRPLLVVPLSCARRSGVLAFVVRFLLTNSGPSLLGQTSSPRLQTEGAQSRRGAIFLIILLWGFFSFSCIPRHDTCMLLLTATFERSCSRSLTSVCG